MRFLETVHTEDRSRHILALIFEDWEKGPNENCLQHFFNWHKADLHVSVRRCGLSLDTLYLTLEFNSVVADCNETSSENVAQNWIQTRNGTRKHRTFWVAAILVAMVRVTSHATKHNLNFSLLLGQFYFCIPLGGFFFWIPSNFETAQITCSSCFRISFCVE
jgi:hypothetical protein